METVLIMSGLLVAILLTTANYLVKGIGGMSAPLQQVGLFLLNKASRHHRSVQRRSR